MCLIQSRTFALLLHKRINDETHILSNNFIHNLSRHGQNKLFNLCFVCFDLARQTAPLYRIFLTWYPFPRPRVISSILIISAMGYRLIPRAAGCVAGWVEYVARMVWPTFSAEARRVITRHRVNCCSDHTYFTFSSENDYFSQIILIKFFPTFLTNKFSLKSKSTLPMIHVSIFHIFLTRAANNSFENVKNNFA